MERRERRGPRSKRTSRIKRRRRRRSFFLSFLRLSFIDERCVFVRELIKRNSLDILLRIILPLRGLVFSSTRGKGKGSFARVFDFDDAKSLLFPNETRGFCSFCCCRWCYDDDDAAAADVITSVRRRRRRTPPRRGRRHLSLSSFVVATFVFARFVRRRRLFRLRPHLCRRR